MQLTLNEWLGRIARQHPEEIELGLGRCGEVYKRLRLSTFSMPIITVAGTNGKGSTVAYLDALARASGKRPLTFTSPHLYDYRERLTFDANWLTEAQHIEAFQAIESAADEIPLTFFEYSALSVFYWCQKLQPDILILEVGLGGRLDTTNLVPADVAIITTVDLDHQEYLGDTIEAIAREKLGVIHPKTTAILADTTVPDVCLDGLLSNKLIKAGETYQLDGHIWMSDGIGEFQLPDCIKPMTNSAAALMAFATLFPQEITTDCVTAANDSIQLAGRYQYLRQEPDVIADVAHNPQAVGHLVERLKQKDYNQISIILGMMFDKNIEAVIKQFNEIVTHWYFCDLDSERAATAAQLSEVARSLGISLKQISCYSSPTEAYQCAVDTLLEEENALLVAGSFLTVGPILEQVKS